MWYLYNASIRCILFALVCVFVVACGGSGDSSPAAPSFQRGEYVSAGRSQSVSASVIDSVLDGVAGSLAVSAVYDVRFLKLTYKTIDTNGRLTNASGVVAIPQKANNLSSPMLSLQHGTIYLDSDAPSNEDLSPLLSNPAQALYKTTGQAIIAASLGYLVVAPDYLGYGDSILAVHPYMHADSLATSVIDLILAAQQYFADNDIMYNRQVFLAGYSEGGYATLAAHKKLQELYSDVMTVTASAPGAGAYDVSQTALTFANSQQLDAPDYVAFVMKAYDTVYNLNRLGDFFQPAYVDFIDSAFYGDTTRTTIVTNLSATPDELFSSPFLQDFTGNGESELKAYFRQNDIYDWSPTSPIYFYHGRQDTIVPFFNVTSVMTAMQNSPVSITECASVPSDHGYCFLPYLQFVIDTFGALTNDL
ncbi:MAG: hypothetical protein AMJ53_07080 [Gammaproteobacteria bacterium SG8_11]|nr:MAG: hypothetical protein AMJ53_07080 [Gammaproteobacteria bacterium SG8_11]